MAEPRPKFYLTTPIYYVNARPHIGHAYTTIVADVLARRHRLLGEEVWFLTGTDEHGQKIERSARAAGIPPQEFADEVSASFRTLWDRMGLTYDQYIRTTDPAHKRGVQKLFRELQDRSYIYLSSYTGQYCVSEEIFVEGPPGTIGPDGRPTETVTEENYFFRLSDFQLTLINLIESDELDIRPETRKNEILSFLRGDLSGERVERSAAGHPYRPGALRDLSISRSSFTWGIPVPGDEKHVIYVWLDALANYLTAVGYGDDSPEAQAKLARFWPADLHIVGKEITRQHCIYWPAFLLAAGLPLPKKIVAHGWLLFEESKMSKSKGNIVRAETILDAFGLLCAASTSASHDTPPPLSSFAEGGGSASALPAPKHDQDLFAADILRYFLLREIPFGQDGSFSFDALITRYNADLTNGYGNLVSRTLTMIVKYFDSAVPTLDHVFKDQLGRDRALGLGLIGYGEANKAQELVIRANGEGETSYSSFLTYVWNLVKWSDDILSLHKPWKAECVPEVRAESLYVAAEGIRILSALLYPVLPYATARVWQQLGLGNIEEAARNGELTNLQWGGLQPGTKLGPLSPIFPRADKGLAQIMTDMEQARQEQAKQPQAPTESSPAAEKAAAAHPEAVPAQPFPPQTDPAAGPRTATLTEPDPGAQVGGSASPVPTLPETPSHTTAQPSGAFAGEAASLPMTTAPVEPTPDPTIGIEDFAKVELRVAKVVVAERIPKADKLLRLVVDLGTEQRQILSGIAEWYTPEDLLGRRIVVVTNLAPRKMRGLDSHGMLLAATGPDGGKPALATFAEADELPLGARLR